ncbi:hypothetical protein ACS0TY_017960 [Phlomoides rotata]
MEIDIKVITDLLPYEDGWTIKVRVARKTSIETYLKNERKTETVKLFLQDEEGSMVQATLFNEQIKKFNEMLESEKCYLISKGNIRPVNKNFDNVNNKIELSFTDATSPIKREGQNNKEPFLISREVKLSTSFISFIEINPDVEQFEAFQQSFQNFSSTAGGMDKIFGHSKRIIELKEVRLANITGNNVDSCSARLWEEWGKY